MTYTHLTDEELERKLYMRLGKSPLIDALYQRHVANMGGEEEVRAIEQQMDEMSHDECPVCDAPLFRGKGNDAVFYS